MTDNLHGVSSRGTSANEHIQYCESIDDCRPVLEDLQKRGDAYGIIYVCIHDLNEVLDGLNEDLAQQVISVLSSRLVRCVRGDDRAFQIGRGDYIVIILGNYTAGAYESLQERIRNAVEEEISIEGYRLHVSVSFGFASYPNDGETGEDLIDQARGSMERSLHSATRAYRLQQQLNEGETAEVKGAHASPDSARAYIDELTGLSDAQLFRSRATDILNDAGRRAEGLSMVFCDIEEFKTYNLKYGYVAGDDLLKFVADTLSEMFPNDPISRLNSDRFCILTDSNDLTEKLERVHELVRSFRSNSNAEIKAGIYEILDENVSASQAQDYARLACDSIKGRYDRSWRRFDDHLSSEVNRRQYIVDNIDTAISADWIEVHYQPIVRSLSGKVYGLEALVRWNDPELGMLPPGEFIDVLEDARLIHNLDIQVVRKVCQEGKRHIDAGDYKMGVSVNLSRLDYQLCDIFTAIDQIVEETGFPRELLHIEFTESAFTQDAEYFSQVIAKFRGAGYEVWMDDFGSGYSSLNLLKDFDFDVLKIDMEFLRGLSESARTRDIVVSVVDMAKKIGIRTLAEGVETEEQANFLLSIGCELQQGFYYSKPMPPNEMDELFETFGIEEADETNYYQTLGKINMLSASPFEQVDAAQHAMEFSQVLPLAVMEREGDNMYISASTSAFDDVVEETGLIEDNGEGGSTYTDKGVRVIQEIIRLGDASDETNAIKYVSFYDFKDLYTLRLQHMASTGQKHAYLVSLEKHDTSQSNMAAFGVGSVGSSTSIPGEGAGGGNMIYLPQAQITPWQQSDEIDLSRTAVLIIDVLGGSEGVTPGLEGAAQNCVTIVKAARAIGMPVVFAIDNHIPGLDHELELWGDHGVRGTQSGTLIDAFEVCDKDFVIPKRRYNGFYQTDLDLTLKELGVDTLIVGGYDTNICVLQTLAGAYFNGYKSIVPADATATFLYGDQEYALNYLVRCYDTRVVDTATVLRYLQR